MANYEASIFIPQGQETEGLMYYKLIYLGQTESAKQAATDKAAAMNRKASKALIKRAIVGLGTLILSP